MYRSLWCTKLLCLKSNSQAVKVYLYLPIIELHMHTYTL
jgi:hypothetical protein